MAARKTRTRARPARGTTAPHFYRIPRVRVSVVREGWVRTRQHPHIKSKFHLAAALASCFPEDEARERFVMAILDARCQIIALHTVSVGCLTDVPVHPRDLLRSAVLAGGSYIGVAHNHCSGDPEPSENDVRLTRRLLRCAELMGIELLDHIIFGAGMRWASLREQGYLEKRKPKGQGTRGPAQQPKRRARVARKAKPWPPPVASR